MRRCRSRSAPDRCRGTASWAPRWLRPLGRPCADVDGAIEIDLEELFYLGVAAVAETVAVTLIDQELVIIDGADFADAGTSGEFVGVLVSDAAGSDVDGDDAQQVGGGAASQLASWISAFCMMPTSVRAVGGDGQAFHAFVGGAAAVLLAISIAPMGLRLVTKKSVGQLEGAKAQAGEAIELVDVGAVLVGDENAAAVVGDADAFRIEAGVVRSLRRSGWDRSCQSGR